VPASKIEEEKGTERREDVKKTIVKIIRGLPLAALLYLTLKSGKAAKKSVSRDEAKALINWYLRARNEAKLALLDNVFSPEVIVHDPGVPEDVRGLAALKRHYQNTHAAFPDLTLSLDDMIIKENRVVWIWTLSGTNTGPLRTPLGDFQATGKPVRFSGVAVDRVADGKVEEEWVYFNVLDILQPLGFALIPSSAPHSEKKL
jgi:steroid delta-isomerase-like uncharacterized protein